MFHVSGPCNPSASHADDHNALFFGKSPFIAIACTPAGRKIALLESLAGAASAAGMQVTALVSNALTGRQIAEALPEPRLLFPSIRDHQRNPVTDDHSDRILVIDDVTLLNDDELGAAVAMAVDMGFGKVVIMFSSTADTGLEKHAAIGAITKHLRGKGVFERLNGAGMPVLRVVAVEGT